MLNLITLDFILSETGDTVELRAEKRQDLTCILNASL